MDPFIAEIRIFAGNFAPRNWATCDGQTFPISQNTALFSLLGVNFGGDGKTTFGLPNLQNSFPMGTGNGPGLTPRSIGDQGGVTSVSLTTSQLPPHSHPLECASDGTGGASPQGGVWLGGGRGRPPVYAPAPPSPPAGTVTLSGLAIPQAGSGLPHNNLSPYLALNFIIALQGVYPQRA